MARKCRIIVIIILGIAIVMAIVTRFSLTQRDADIYTRKGKFYGVFEVDDVPSENEINEEIEESDVIAIVRPTEEIEVYAYNVMQKVEIVEILKGDKSITEERWISCNNGLYEGYNWGMDNLMYPDYEYLVVLQEYEGNLFNEFFMGAIRLDSEKTWNVIDVEKEYSYEELRNEKYFAVDKETLELLYEREAYLLKLLNIEKAEETLETELVLMQ